MAAMNAFAVVLRQRLASRPLRQREPLLGDSQQRETVHKFLYSRRCLGVGWGSSWFTATKKRESAVLDNELVKVKRLASGSFGHVDLFRHQGKPLAVKVLIAPSINAKQIRSFKRRASATLHSPS